MTTNEEVIFYTPAPALNGSVNWQKRIKPGEIRRYWDSVIGIDKLEDNETIRMTAIRPWMNGTKLQSGQRTMTEQIRSADELISRIEENYGLVENEYKHLVGYSISAGIYRYGPDLDGEIKAPGKQSLLRINTMVIDIDTHIEEKGKLGRFHFNSFNKDSRRILAAKVILTLNMVLYNKNVDLVIHSDKTYATGGGLQFHIKFDKYLSKLEADSIFRYIKTSLIRLKEEKFIGYGIDEMGTIRSCWFEFDESCGDCTHTQRLGGTVNPKEAYIGSFSEEIKDFNNLNKLRESVKTLLKNVVDKPNNMSDAKFSSIRNSFNNILDGMIKNDEISQKIVKYTHMKNSAYLSSREDFNKTKNANEIFGNSSYDVIKQISIDDQTKIMHDLIIQTYTDDQLEAAQKLDSSNNARFQRYFCPFHDDSNDPSFVIYNNNDGSGVARANDQHDNSSMNLIEFMIAISKVLGDLKSPNQIIGELTLQFPNLVLSTSNKKELNKNILGGSVDDLITRVDVKDYIYYRLANKQRACIIRDFELGRSHIFDGTRMLTDHILIHQLGFHDKADNELRSAFHDKFVERILINAFEEFKPGSPSTYTIKNIKYVNLWIPGAEYEKIHKMAEDIGEMDIVSAIEIIKSKLPNMWFYLNQITQQGNLEYFVNWLICVSQFKIMSNIPVITSVQGAGKGVFVEHILERYLNHEYVNIVNTAKMSNNFNSFMGTSNLIVMDESDFSGTKDIDNLKMLSGNKYIHIEKKGVDSMKIERKFNFLMLTNGITPIRHPSSDRRITYFRLDVSLADSIKHSNYEDIDDFISSVKEEVLEFWAIMIKTIPNKTWSNMNLKDNQFNKQILLMHPFGELIIKMLNNEWSSIKLQVNEHVDDPIAMAANIEMIETIKRSFDNEGYVNLTIINKYIKSINFKSFIGVQQFIEMNNLKANGIIITPDSKSVKIHIDKNKVKNLIHMSNNLGKVLDCYKDDAIEATCAQSFNDNQYKNDDTIAKSMDFALQPHNKSNMSIPVDEDLLGINIPKLHDNI